MTVTVLCESCPGGHFYRFTPKCPNFYPTPTLVWLRSGTGLYWVLLLEAVKCAECMRRVNKAPPRPRDDARRHELTPCTHHTRDTTRQARLGSRLADRPDMSRGYSRIHADVTHTYTRLRREALCVTVCACCSRAPMGIAGRATPTRRRLRHSWPRWPRLDAPRDALQRLSSATRSQRNTWKLRRSSRARRPL